MVLSELRRPLQNALLHDFSSFEFHDCAGRDEHFLLGLFWITADTLLGESCREDAKFTELDALAIAELLPLPSQVECPITTA